MKRVRVVVEVDVPDDSPLTEKRLVWALRHKLSPVPSRPVLLVEGRHRVLDVKQFSRVMQYQPGGVRCPAP